MAGGPISPSSAIPDSSGNCFPYVYHGAGANASPNEETLGVAASIGADCVYYLRFPMPPTIPTGTLKLRLLGLAVAGSTLVAKLTVADGNCPAGSQPSGISLTSETQTTMTFSVALQDKYVEAKIPLTTTPNGNDMLVVALTFNHTGWTLNVLLALIATILWE